MAQHFHGFVTRFSAGRVEKGREAGWATSMLEGLGMSASAARSVIAAGPVASPPDRDRLGAIVGAILDLTAPKSVAQIVVLLPAVQKIREVSRRSEEFGELGFSAGAAHQIVFGQPILDPRDRSLLACLLAAAAQPGGGGANALRLDDSAGSEK